MQFNEITFCYPGREPVTVPVNEAFRFADNADVQWSPSYVHWTAHDGAAVRSFAKGWWDRDSGRLVRVGGGVYGDTPVINR
jgi:hypothetical protein